MKGMARMRKRLLDDFIIPALNSNQYGNKLCWVDKEQGIFRLYWSHKNAAKWEMDDTEVFQQWDRLKGHYQPNSKNYFMSAKQRFRAALYKLSNYVTPIKSNEKTFRDYQLKINETESRKQSENLSKSKAKGLKRASQPAIPTPVICKNMSYISKPVPVQKQKPSSPVYINDVGKLYTQYSTDMDRINNLKKKRDHEKMYEQKLQEKYNKEVCESSVLRENSSTSRTTHIAPQPIPLHPNYKHYLHYPIHNGPDAFVSQIYNGPENVPYTKIKIERSMSITDEEMYAADGILNLSKKSDSSSSPPSR